MANTLENKTFLRTGVAALALAGGGCVGKTDGIKIDLWGNNGTSPVRHVEGAPAPVEFTPMAAATQPPAAPDTRAPSRTYDIGQTAPAGPGEPTEPLSPVPHTGPQPVQDAPLETPTKSAYTSPSDPEDGVDRMREILGLRRIHEHGVDLTSTPTNPHDYHLGVNTDLGQRALEAIALNEDRRDKRDLTLAWNTAHEFERVLSTGEIHPYDEKLPGFVSDIKEQGTEVIVGEYERTVLQPNIDAREKAVITYNKSKSNLDVMEKTQTGALGAALSFSNAESERQLADKERTLNDFIVNVPTLLSEGKINQARADDMTAGYEAEIATAREETAATVRTAQTTHDEGVARVNAEYDGHRAVALETRDTAIRNADSNLLLASQRYWSDRQAEAGDDYITVTTTHGRDMSIGLPNGDLGRLTIYDHGLDRDGNVRAPEFDTAPEGGDQYTRPGTPLTLVTVDGVQYDPVNQADELAVAQAISSGDVPTVWNMYRQGDDGVLGDDRKADLTNTIDTWFANNDGSNKSVDLSFSVHVPADLADPFKEFGGDGSYTVPLEDVKKALTPENFARLVADGQVTLDSIGAGAPRIGPDSVTGPDGTFEVGSSARNAYTDLDGNDNMSQTLTLESK
jgi:hypothetical protein